MSEGGVSLFFMKFSLGLQLNHFFLQIFKYIFTNNGVFGWFFLLAKLVFLDGEILFRRPT